MQTAIVVAWLAAELLKIPGSRAPGETREEYEARVREVTTALVEEARPMANGKGWSLTELAAAAGVIWHGESMFDKRIHAGEEHPIWNQDHGLARCSMQLHRSGLVPQDVWENLVGLGTDSTRLCAQYGLRVIVAQARQCGVFHGQRADRRRVAMTLASYATGGKCKPADREWERADRWVRIMATRPDRSPVKGYRRAPPVEIPPKVKEEAAIVVANLGPGGYGPGARFPLGKWLLLVERHANNKVGVSVLVRE